jgi:hypothetical protein
MSLLGYTGHSPSTHPSGPAGEMGIIVDLDRGLHQAQAHSPGTDLVSLLAFPSIAARRTNEGHHLIIVTICLKGVVVHQYR